MKLYEFEKYYLRLARYKTLLFVNRVFKYRIAQYIGLVLLFFGCVTLAALIVIYFFLGVNVFLEKIHLEKYRIEKVTIIKSDFDLRPYFKR